VFWFPLLHLLKACLDGWAPLRSSLRVLRSTYEPLRWPRRVGKHLSASSLDKSHPWDS
jgi:hypothetical protein